MEVPQKSLKTSTLQFPIKFKKHQPLTLQEMLHARMHQLGHLFCHNKVDKAEHLITICLDLPFHRYFDMSGQTHALCLRSGL
jgi:hypothetical protein